MKKLLALLISCGIIAMSGTALAEEAYESAETPSGEEALVSEAAEENEEAVVSEAAEENEEAVAAEEESEEETVSEEAEEEAAKQDEEKEKSGKKASKDKGEKSKEKGEKSQDKGEKSKDKGEKSQDKGEKSKDKGEKSQDKGEKSKENGEKSQDKGEKSKDKGQKSQDKGEKSKDKSGNKNTLGNGITKDILRVRKELFKSIHKEIKEYIKAEKELFKNADAEAREEILADIAALKRELSDYTIGAFIKGCEVDFEEYDGVKPEIENNRTLVPVRAILEKYDAELSWDGESRTITVTRGDTVVVMTIGSTVAAVNGEEVTVEAPPVIKNNRTLVPIRFLSEQFNMDVSWDEDSRTIIIEEQE